MAENSPILLAPEKVERPQQSRSHLPLAKDLTSRTIVLTYHDMVRKRDGNSLWFDCTPQELEEQLDWMTSQGAVFLSLDELWEGLTGRKKLMEKAVVITFADNYQGFYDLAWPILKKRQIPAALFVHTGHVGSQKGRPKMSWSTLKELQAGGLVTVQSQTVSHPEDISSLPADRMDEEFTGSKRAIEERLGSMCWAIAYPNGRFSTKAAEAAARAGYVLGLTEEQSFAESAPSIMLAPRWVHTRWKEAWNLTHSRRR